MLPVSVLLFMFSSPILARGKKDLDWGMHFFLILKVARNGVD
jgi:hypothetical protein